MFPMSDILDDIRVLASNEIEDLGRDVNSQNAAIFRFTNIVMEKRARQAYIVEWSDPLNIAADGKQTFLRNGIPITDLYEPLGMNMSTNFGAQVPKRYSFETSNGWIHEADNTPIDTRGLTGSYVLKYLRYPAKITAVTDTVEFPRAAKWDLIFDVVALCKLPKNYYEEFAAIKSRATGTTTVKAAIAAKGTNSAPPSILDREE